MRYMAALLALGAVSLLGTDLAFGQTKCTGKRFTLVVHGGAGTGNAPPAIQRKKRRVLRQALVAGRNVLDRGGTAVDSVTAAITLLEDSPIFNAGRGGIPNKAGFVELDASIMDGRDRNAGAVAATRTIRNPILAARAAMEKSAHVMFVDRGAESFAKSAGLEIVNPTYFLVKPSAPRTPSKSGTVGAVALDRCGNLAAGTSTGGYNAKTPGRVGDSPIIGAGTFAINATCAVSATGWGEYFIRWSAAYDISALVEYKGYSIQKSADTVLHDKLKPAGATGGVIVLDAKGNVAYSYTSNGMIRGSVDNTGRIEVGIFGKMTSR